MKIIYPAATGGVAVIHPTGELSIEEVAKKDVPAGVAYTIVNDEDVPSDRTFRNAWKHDLTVDFSKAQALTKERLRSDRKPLLEAQDVLFQRALETGKDATAIVKEKQRLRDVTKLVDGATTLDALKGVTV